MEFRHILLIIIGGMLGFGSLVLARLLIKQRGETPSGKLYLGAFSIIFWTVVGALVGFGLGWLDINWIRTIELLLLFFTLLALSLVDGKIKKIPNQLLIAFLALRLAVLIYGTIIGEASGQDWLGSLLGGIFGWLAFMVPGIFGLSAGWGDVKLAAVAGFYLKIVGLIQALLVMSLIILVYGLVLVITKKGSFKTAVAYGPALSGGIIVTALLPLADKLL